MNIEEYKLKLENARNEYESNKDRISTEFAESNNPYKIGDVVTDHYHTIKIEKHQIAFTGMNAIPECVFFGTELKKDGTPKKRQENNPVYQSNIGK